MEKDRKTSARPLVWTIAVGAGRQAISAMIALILLGACGGDESLLDVLKDDDLASVTLPMATQTRVNEREFGSFGGFESPAMVRHSFAVPRGAEQTAADALAEAARAAGWIVEQQGFGYNGSKRAAGDIPLSLLIEGSTESRVWIEISTRGRL